MRFRSHQSTTKPMRLGVETLEHKMLLAADVLASSLVQDHSPVTDTAETAAGETVDANLVVFPGDANRDGVFNQQDLVQLFLADKYLTRESADWSEGDWNGDNVFDQQDILAALQIGNYTPQGVNAGKSSPHEAHDEIIAALAEETAARMAADDVLTLAIVEEIAARAAADTELIELIEEIELTPGPEGPPGPQGPDGPQAELLIVNGESGFLGLAPGEGDVDFSACPPDTAAVGRSIGDNVHHLDIFVDERTFPSEFTLLEHGWRLGAVNNAGLSSDAQITFRAICVGTG